MKISKQVRREAKQLFRCCLVDGLLDEGRVRLVLRQVVEARPRGYLGMLSHFHRLVKLEVQRRTARVESAVPLDANLQGRVQAGLAQRYGAGLNLAFAQNPALLGGLRIQVGCDVYDGSVQARLAALEESF
jgi:F-type H+-transporting ATPase subunit delta